MWLEAIVPLEDLQRLLPTLAPVVVKLGTHATVSLPAPSAVTLVAGVGLRVICAPTLHGALFGLDVPVQVASATVLLTPSVALRRGREVLVFRLRLEAIDVTAVPLIVETVAVDSINAALLDDRSELTWDFSRSLSHRFALPEGFGASSSLALSVAWGAVRVTPEALVLAVSIHAADDVDTPPAAALARRSAMIVRRPARVPAAIAVLGGLLTVVLGALGLAAARALLRRV